MGENVSCLFMEAGITVSSEMLGWVDQKSEMQRHGRGVPVRVVP